MYELQVISNELNNNAHTQNNQINQSEEHNNEIALNMNNEIYFKEIVFEEDICCICLDNIYDNNFEKNQTSTSSYIYLPCCKNNIHKDCFIQWLLIKTIETNCPICRFNFEYINEMINITDLYNIIISDYKINVNNFNNINSILKKYYSYHKGNYIICPIFSFQNLNNFENNTNHPEEIENQNITNSQINHLRSERIDFINNFFSICNIPCMVLLIIVISFFIILFSGSGKK